MDGQPIDRDAQLLLFGAWNRPYVWISVDGGEHLQTWPAGEIEKAREVAAAVAAILGCDWVELHQASEVDPCWANHRLDRMRACFRRDYRDLCDRVASDPRMNDVSVLPQLHTLAWGNEKER